MLIGDYPKRMRRRMRWWKVLGLAGLAGVAASGVVIARAERRRRAYTPEEIRARLRDRHAEASSIAPAEADG
ncbi:hypothetical protein ENC19_17810 [Verrucosispora sp. CWR15]|uniref:Uncharacterized protein n=2 Tax=Micromonosporaceae TaxID=28056 RepID=A0A6M1L827_9ACTN|nr:hypothetical protein [Verrucosispora sioxanthis]NGM14389.1 hypothetical protein [Verrucosispora sioxanthis]